MSSPAHWLGLLARGVAMGVAEVVPGVSGGTIAFVTGIYPELVRTLAGFGPGSLRLLLEKGPVAFWEEHNLAFLGVLLAGMAVGVLVFAQLMGYWLDVAPAVVWGFFFGLIVVSVVQIGYDRPLRHLLVFGVVGCIVGITITGLNPLPPQHAVWVFFVGGIFAISAWMLPAISGSFVLLILGLYQPVIEALNAWHWPVLASLAAGCMVGVLAFSKVLAWLMAHRREPLLALLTGFMAGSLLRLWPWSHAGALLSPAGYTVATGQDAMVLGTCVAALAGAFALWLVSSVVSRQ